MSRLIRAYEGMLKARPMATKAVAGGTLALAGDVVAQRVKEGRPAVDARRAAAFTGFGVMWTGVFNHWWYGALAAALPGTGALVVASKLAAQHGLLNPLVYLPLFYSSQGVLLGLSREQSLSKAKAEYWSTLTRLWAIWLPASTIMFKFVPVRHQVLYTAGVSLGWNTLLSVMYRGGETDAAGAGDGSEGAGKRVAEG